MLTAPNGLFIDIRILKETSNRHDPSSIDWAFCGISRKSGNSGSWEHWVDSRSDNPDPDSGTFETLENGDDLEKGVMKNADGILTTYEEIWRDLPLDTRPESCPILVYIGLDIKDAAGPPSETLSMEGLHSEAVRGMMIRIDSWCQGLVKTGEETSVERWQLLDESWRCTVRIGTTGLPCSNILQAAIWPDDILGGGDLIWKRLKS